MIQLVSGLSRLDCDGGSVELKDRCVERWVKDLSVIRIDFYHTYTHIYIYICMFKLLCLKCLNGWVLNQI